MSTTEAEACGTIDDARRQLAAFASTYAQRPESREALRQLEAAARFFVRAQEAAAAGITATKAQAARDERQGVRLCASCAVPVRPAQGADGGPMRWLDARTFQPHHCSR